MPLLGFKVSMWCHHLSQLYSSSKMYLKPSNHKHFTCGIQFQVFSVKLLSQYNCMCVLQTCETCI